MKQIIFILCIFFAFLTCANAGEMYDCIDRNGNSIVTDNPQEGMKNCVLKVSSSQPSSEEPKNEKKKTIARKDIANEGKKDYAEEREKKIEACFNCCRDKNRACYNYTAKGRACHAEGLDCVATCKSEGSSPSTWSDCWSNSN